MDHGGECTGCEWVRGGGGIVVDVMVDSRIVWRVWDLYLCLGLWCLVVQGFGNAGILGFWILGNWQREMEMGWGWDVYSG